MTEQQWLTSEDPQAMLTSQNHGHGIEISDRKLRLFACACCRAVWDLLTDALRAKVMFGEQEPFQTVNHIHAEYTSQYYLTEYVQNVGRERCLSYACGWLGAPNAREVAHQAPAWLQDEVPFPLQAALLRDVVGNPFSPITLGPSWHTPTVLSLATAAYLERTRTREDCPKCEGYSVGKLLRCDVCDNRGRVHLEGGTLDPVRLAILADALEEIGCTNEDILRHLRGQEPYAECVICSKKPGTPVLCTRCIRNRAAGWMPLRSPHVRGCWVLDLILGKE